MSEAIVKKQSWLQMLTIQAGATICLPVIMVGQLVSQKYGVFEALIGVTIGNAFLLAIGYVIATLSVNKPQSTTAHAADTFGNQGGVLFAVLMILLMMGWFGIQLNVMSLSVKQQFPNLPIAGINICLGIGISALMCLGMRAMKGLSMICAPLLGFTLLFALFTANEPFAEAMPISFSWIKGLSIVIGANIAAVIDLPSYFRYAKSKADAKVCIVLLYGVVVPFIEIVGIYLTSLSGEDSILGVLQAGGGAFWMLWMGLFVFLSGWGTNNGNLYSSITTSYSLVQKGSPIIRALTLGGVGTLIAYFNPLGNIEEILGLFGITIGAMGAVIVANNLLQNKRAPLISMLSWAMGVLVGLTTAFGQIRLTGVSTFDAFLIAFFAFIIIKTRSIDYETINN